MTVANNLKVLSIMALISIATGRLRPAARPDAGRQGAAANDRFKDVSVAVAEGYAAIPCASGIDGGAMGVHYVSEKLLKADAIDIGHPQAVMYEPGADGKMTLIAVEYITSKGPAGCRASSSTSWARPTAMGSGRSTSCTSGRGRATRAAPSPT